MKDAYLKLLWAGMFITGIIYASFAALGFYFYGSSVEESVALNIGLALDGSALPHLGVVKNAVLIAIWVKLIAVYPFISESVMVAFRASFHRFSGLRLPAESITIAMSVLLLLTMITNVIFPTLFYMRFCGVANGKTKFVLAACALFFGIGVGAYGTQNAVASMLSGGDDI
eukprot:CAMPEP_0180569942 /NCGR_PEP_ID=MMETSP1037_2-20121125/7943_1 /TAXON_ID=632150 /ORGANISM="Azadinium spinosum, Strain 3D9" /LENGTH=170 /DNA_ID=CAMNT_0022587203 /DNA_START=76 /DNA_END=589 /DNA_ORIENTATION=-